MIEKEQEKELYSEKDLTHYLKNDLSEHALFKLDKPSWFKRFFSHASFLMQKKENIKKQDDKIESVTQIQLFVQICCAFACLFSIFPLSLGIALLFKQFFILIGFGNLFTDSSTSHGFIYGFVIVSFILSMAIIQWVARYISRFISGLTIFNRHKAPLIVQKQQLVETLNQEHNAMEMIFSDNFKSELLDYFKSHFPGLDCLGEADTGHGYHEDYHQLKKAFTASPVDYPKAVEAMARLHAVIDEKKTHQEQKIIDEENRLLKKIQHLI